MLKVKESELLKMIAERDAEVADASNMIASASKELDIVNEEKKKMSIDSQLEYLNRKREIDIKIIELNRELDLAYAEEKAAETGYKTFIAGIGPQRIVALKAGVLTGISKNVGDYVTPEQSLASLRTSADAHDSFVRFRVPNDAVLPSPGDEVVVIRPGFPFDKKKAIIIGIGNTLDDNGSFVGEAEFVDEVDWPVRALVRVIPAGEGAILVPFGAIRWNEEGEASLRIVTAKGEIEKRAVIIGRAIGDKVEILKNLSAGESFIPIQASDDMLEKMKAGIPVPPPSEMPAKKGEMDMDDH
jgi:multidrug efflux pump subunit AcrA (membrane-fusion protein)